MLHFGIRLCKRSSSLTLRLNFTIQKLNPSLNTMALLSWNFRHIFTKAMVVLELTLEPDGRNPYG